MRPSEVLEKHRDAIRRIIAARRGANPRVFGSVARGTRTIAKRHTDTDDGDIDILIDRVPGLTLFDLGRMVCDIEDLFQVSVDIVTSDSPPPHRLKLILEEAKPV